MDMKSLTITCTAISILFYVEAGSAKGLEVIQPRTPEEKAEAASSNQPSTKPTTNTAVPVDPSKSTDPNASGAAVEEVAKKEPPSAASLAIANKLLLGVGYGFVRIPNAKLGAFTVSSAADLSVYWKLRSFESSHWDLHFRYAPISAENRIDDRSYRSVIEGYHIGTDWQYQFATHWYASAALEVGYLLVYMRSRDQFDVEDKYENNEVALTLGSGVDWLASEKLRIGPKIYAGFGAFQIVQLNVAATLSF